MNGNIRKLLKPRKIEGINTARCIRAKEIPNGAVIIDPKWIYDIKTKTANGIIRFKTRLSVIGDQLDFEDIGNVYSQVVF
jgi:hypothetical protein